MIQKELIEKIYVAASMQRWMDHIRPVEFTELDKQAHKMTIAFVIAKYEELINGKGRLDWIKLIEGGFFEFLQRVVLTDIKPSDLQSDQEQTRGPLESALPGKPLQGDGRREGSSNKV